MTVNKVILIGNLGADPDVRTTNSGTKVASLRLATTERRKQADGNWGDHTEWHRVTVFGRTAENVERYLSKGSQVYIEGRLQTRKYQDKSTGQDRYSTEIVTDNLRFLGGRGDGGAPRRDSGGYGGQDRGGYGGQDGGSFDNYGGPDDGGFGGGADDGGDIPF